MAMKGIAGTTVDLWFMPERRQYKTYGEYSQMTALQSEARDGAAVFTAGNQVTVFDDDGEWAQVCWASDIPFLVKLEHLRLAR